jgi:hypothetical protein
MRLAPNSAPIVVPLVAPHDPRAAPWLVRLVYRRGPLPVHPREAEADVHLARQRQQRPQLHGRLSLDELPCAPWRDRGWVGAVLSAAGRGVRISRGPPAAPWPAGQQGWAWPRMAGVGCSNPVPARRGPSAPVCSPPLAVYVHIPPRSQPVRRVGGVTSMPWASDSEWRPDPV